jgi:hypothetical protein
MLMEVAPTRAPPPPGKKRPSRKRRPLFYQGCAKIVEEAVAQEINHEGDH